MSENTNRRGTGWRALGYLAPALTLLVGVTGLLHVRDRAAVRDLLRARAAHVVELAATRLDRDVTVPVQDVRFISEQQVVREFLETPESARAALESEWTLFMGARGRTYHQIRLLGLDGEEIVRVERRNGAGTPYAVPPERLQDKSERYYFEQARALPRGEVFVSRLDLNVERGQVESPWRPVVRFAGPVFDRGGARRAIVVLNFLAEPTLSELDSLAAQGPGDTWLVNADGHYLRGVPTGHRFAFMFGRDTPSFAVDRPGAWSRLQAGRPRFESRGVWYVGRRLTSSPLHVIGAVDDAAVAAAARGLGPLIALAAAAATLLAVLAWWVAQAEEVRRAHEDRLHALSQRLMRAQEDERRAVARDLHDELGQVVTVLNLHLRRLALTSDPDRRQELTDQAVEAARQVLTGIRQLGERVRSSLLDDLGLAEATRSLVADFERRSGVVAQAEIDLGGVSPPPEVAEVAYRILQEALTNAWRHAEADAVHVELTVLPNRLLMTIRDAGKGFGGAADAGGGLGLLGMRERAELVDGKLTLRSRRGEGTEIAVEIPLPTPEST